VLGGLRPSLIGHAASGVGDPSALLRELEGGTLGFGEAGCLPPGCDQVDASLAVAGVEGVPWCACRCRSRIR
jgi:hypothetical protein